MIKRLWDIYGGARKRVLKEAELYDWLAESEYLIGDVSNDPRDRQTTDILGSVYRQKADEARELYYNTDPFHGIKKLLKGYFRGY